MFFLLHSKVQVKLALHLLQGHVKVCSLGVTHLLQRKVMKGGLVANHLLQGLVQVDRVHRYLGRCPGEHWSRFRVCATLKYE